MKFDIFAWSEIEPNLWFNGPAGSLVVKASAPSALFVEQDGFEVCAGHGVAFDLDISGEFRFRLEGPKSARFFYQAGASVAVPSLGVVYTNADKLPAQSGTYFEVRRALREQQLAQSAMMKEIRAATSLLRAERKALSRASALPAANASGTEPAQEGSANADA